MPRWSAFAPEIDRELVKGLNDEEERGLAALYDAYVEQMFDYAVALVGEVKAAEDVVHDVFIDASRRALRLRDRDRFRAWLYAAVRRRGLFRSRGRGISWDWAGHGLVGGETGLAMEEVRLLVEGAFGRVSFSDQDLLLLSLRHGLTGVDLAAVLGVSPHKATVRAGKAKARAEAALAAQLRTQESACEGEGGEEGEEQEHRDACDDCARRASVPLALLLAVPPAPIAPTGLRHRVLHTGSDPELAGYRADISGKGGHLTPEGLPRQPDVPSPLGRKWLFASSGMAGALGATLVASFMFGPGIAFPPVGDLPEDDETPSLAQPAPSPKAPTRTALAGPVASASGGKEELGAHEGEEDSEPPTPQATATSEPPTEPEPDATEPILTVSPLPTVTVAPSITTPAVAQLKVGDTAVQVGGGKSTEIDLTAENAPVTWSATSDNREVSLDAANGTVGVGETYPLVVRLNPSLLRLPGDALITITNDITQAVETVTVSWGLILL